MKALTLTQPWAQLVVLGKKEYETRSWGTRYRGWLAIHAGKGHAWEGINVVETQYFRAALRDQGRNLPLGAVVGVVELVEVMATDEVLVSGREATFGDFRSGRKAWRLTAPVWLEVPIPCRGALGLWELPVDIERQIHTSDPTGTAL